jgi:hypothetical protein
MKSPKKPEFFDSLVEADNNESPKDDKENDIKSPRNRFAVLSPSKKPKFNLNAPFRREKTDLTCEIPEFISRINPHNSHPSI